MNFSRLFVTSVLGCLLSGNVSARYEGVPFYGENSAYKTYPISESEYNQNTDGRAYKFYMKKSDGSLEKLYHKYDLSLDKGYIKYISTHKNLSSDGAVTNIAAGVGLNNTGNLAQIEYSLYKDNQFDFTFTGGREDVFVKGGAIYNSGVIGKTDENGKFVGNAVQADFVGNKLVTQVETEGLLRVQGGALANVGQIGDISGDFIENSVHGKFGWGGAVHNSKNAYISGMSGDFVRNSVTGHSSGGGAIVNEGKIDNIIGSFVGNSVKTDSYAVGGAIHNNDNGNIDSINGNFVSNKVEGTQQAFGGGIDNYSGTIGNITADYNNNSVISTDASAISGSFGGAVSNQNGRIQAMYGDYLGNTVQAANQAIGGGIYNVSGQIGLVDGSFIQNTVTSTNGEAFGGAIYNEDSEIKNVSGSFIENKVFGKTSAKGGAVYSMDSTNSGKGVHLVNSSFKKNSVTSDGVAKGGAIYADKAYITADGGSSVFLDNTANGVNNAIYVDGTAQKGELNLTTAHNGEIDLYDSVDGENYDINIRGDGTGGIYVNNQINNADVLTISDGATLHLGGNANININDYIAQSGQNSPKMVVDVLIKDTGDQLKSGLVNVNGDVQGKTDVIVNSYNNNRMQNIDDAVTAFLKAENDDLSTYSNFDVKRVVGSPYMWETAVNQKGETSGSTWYLIADEKYVAPEVPAYIGIHTAAIEQVRGVNHKIAAGLRTSQNRGCCDRKYPYKHNAWINADYVSSTIDTPAETDVEIKGFTGGVDLYADGTHNVGLFAGQHKGEYDLSGKGKMLTTAGTDMDIDSYIGGLYYQYGTHNWNILTSLYGGKQNISLDTKDNITSADTDAVFYGANIDVARKYYMPAAWIIEPSIGVSYMALDVDKFDDNMGKSVDMDLVHYVEAELGLRVEYLFCANGWTTKVYAKPSIIQTFADGDTVKITQMKNVDSYKNQTLGKIEIGAKFGLAHALSAYTSADYTLGKEYEGFGVNAGLNYTW